MKITIDQLIINQKAFYKSIVSIYCPILNQTIYFSSDGFDHLINDSHRKNRKVNEQWLKLSCLKYVPKVIIQCKEVIDIRQFSRKEKNKWVNCTSYALLHEVQEGVKIRVIIEKIGKNGKHKFKSVMPHNKHSKPKKAKKRL